MSESLYGFDPFENYWLRRTDAARGAKEAASVPLTAPVPQLGGLRINPADLSAAPSNPYAERPALAAQPMSEDAPALASTTPPAAPQAPPPPVQPPAPAQAPPAPPPAAGTPVPRQGDPAAAPQPVGAEPRGIRNNNPLNIRDGGFASGQEGYQGSDGAFARFATAEQGMQAADRLLQSYARRGLVTPLSIISRWAPRGDGDNNPEEYAATVSRAMGIGPNDTLNMDDPAVRRRLAEAMSVVENGRGGSSTSGATSATAAASPQVGADVVAQAPDYSADKALLRSFDASSTEGRPQIAQRDQFGLTPADWFGAAGGFFSGRNPMESLGRGTTALSTGLRQADQQQLDLANRAEDRAQRRVQFQQQLQLRRDTLNQTAQDRALNRAIAFQRIQQAGERGTAGGQNVQRSEQLIGPDGSPYTALVLRDGTTRFVDAQNQPVTDPSVLQGLQRRSDTGTGRSNNEIAEDDTKAVTETVQEAAAARSLRQSTANARAILQQNPNIVGSDWGTQGQRFLAQALGIQIGSMNPRDIQALERALQTGQMQDVMRLAPSLRPMSNVDLQMIMRQAPSVMANPQLLGAWLDQIDTAAQRSEARAAALLEARQSPEAIARMRQTGGARVWLERHNAEREQERRGGADRPAPDLRVPSRPGESYTYQPPGSTSPITIRRVN